MNRFLAASGDGCQAESASKVTNGYTKIFFSTKQARDTAFQRMGNTFKLQGAPCKVTVPDDPVLEGGAVSAPAIGASATLIPMKLKGFTAESKSNTPVQIVQGVNQFLCSTLPQLPEHMKAVSSTPITGDPLFCKVFFSSHEALKSAMNSIDPTGSRDFLLFGCKITCSDPSNTFPGPGSASTARPTVPMKTPTALEPPTVVTDQLGALSIGTEGKVGPRASGGGGPKISPNKGKRKSNSIYFIYENYAYVSNVHLLQNERKHAKEESRVL